MSTLDLFDGDGSHGDMRDKTNAALNTLNSDKAETKSDVGLGNAQNTADIDKPVSNPTQAALDIITGELPNDQTGISYTLAASDKNKPVWMKNAAPNAIIIPNNTVTPFTDNFTFDAIQEDDGVTTISASAGVSLNDVSAGFTSISGGKYKRASATRRGENNWIIFGDINKVFSHDIAELFSIDLFSGAQTIVNDLDFINNTGVFWGKSIGAPGDHQLYSTVRGATNEVNPNLTSAEVIDATGLTSFNNDGVTVGASFPSTQVGRSFLAAPRFVDVIEYDGDGVAGREVDHFLGVQAGMCVIKRLNGAANWVLQHISRGGTKTLHLSDDIAELTNSTHWNDTTMTDKVITLGTNGEFNAVGGNYLMVVFAHDTASDGLVQCGEFDATGGNVEVVLGWTPQSVDMTPYDAVGDWENFDTVRGITNELNSNLPDAQTTTSRITLTATGFTFVPNEATNYIFMAIREA